MPRNFTLIKGATAYIFGFGLGILGYYAFTNPTEVGATAFNWQQLIGSFVGAATPLVLFLITEWNQGNKRRKEYLFLLEKNIVTAINNLADTDRMLHAFQDVQLATFKLRIKEDDMAHRPSVGQAFVPLSWVFTFDKELFKETTGSSYLENLVMQIVSTSQEMPILLQDVSRQFDRTLNLNTQIGLMKLNAPEQHNQILRDNIQEFETFLNLQTFGNNIPVYLRMLVQTKVALQKMIRDGHRKWKKTFDYGSVFTNEVSEKMTLYFKSEVDHQIGELQQNFKSKLLLVGEQPPNPYR